MAGIIFLRTRNLEGLTRFYCSQIGMTTWLDQGGCVILKHGNLLLGLCQTETQQADTDGMVTFFYECKADVDAMYLRMKAYATDEPRENGRYRIYQFFAKDPEGRNLEFQYFLDSLEPYQTGAELLISRRSIREYQATDVPDDLLWKVLELCRYAPTSRNRQPYYFIVIRNRDTIDFLAGLRGKSSAPIANAPLAVAICADAEISKRAVQDGDIAAYHFVLAAKLFGLGTCWIAAMDRDDVKEALAIPQHHYVATVTPLGYPAEVPEMPPRKGVSEFVRMLS